MKKSRRVLVALLVVCVLALGSVAGVALGKPQARSVAARASFRFFILLFLPGVGRRATRLSHAGAASS